MILTPKQDEAVNIISRRYQSGEAITVVAGYAGTGKSTLINYFIENMDLMGKTVFCTFTGKASLVLRKQGLPAMTIHKLIYDAFLNRRTGKFYFRLKQMLDEDYDLIVVDEISMVPKKLLEDLLFFGIPIVALGDPGQLPPIGENNGLLDKPQVFLEEIHRQAADNSIINLSMLVRQGKPLSYLYDDPYVKIISKDELSLPMMEWADQILCAKNNTRTALNKEMREYLGFSGLTPMIGDKCICLRNYWDVLNEDGYPLINGTIGIISSIEKGPDFGKLGQKLIASFVADYTDNPFNNLSLDSNIFNGTAPMSMSSKGKFILHELDFGYAITVHKSQGSSYDKALVYEEFLKGSSENENHRKWLYTAITRAKEKLIIVKA